MDSLFTISFFDIIDGSNKGYGAFLAQYRMGGQKIRPEPPTGLILKK